MIYQEFLKSKAFIEPDKGFEVGELNPAPFDFQADAIRFQLRKGRALTGMDTGLGKTITEGETAHQCYLHTGKPSLIVAPLSVARQTIKIVKEVLGYDVLFSARGENADNPIVITNYEMLHHQDPRNYGFVAFDESSIFKGGGKYYRQVLEHWTPVVPYISLNSATQSPNRPDEYGLAAAALGIVKSPDEVRSEFFINKGKKSGGKHVLRELGKEKFFRWLSTWSINMRIPSDLGYDDDGFVLPSLHIEPQFINAGYVPNGMLFMTKAGGIGDKKQTSRTAIYKGTMEARVNAVEAFVNDHHQTEQGIIWCLRNLESTELAKRLGGQAVEVTGTMSTSKKIQAIQAFQDGMYRILITKPKIAAFGMNFQNANWEVWAGINDSWETWKQGIARVHRFKQEKECYIYPIVAESQMDVWNNLMQKDKQNNQLLDELIAGTQDYSKEELQQGGFMIQFNYDTATVTGEGWTAMLGDCIERLKELADNSIDEIVSSIPFEALFTYTATERDLGNCKSLEEFLIHLSFVIKELYRVLKPGRNAFIHVMDIPARKGVDGHIGMKDFSGATIKAFEDGGFFWYGGRIFIEKNQQAKAITQHVFGLSLSHLEIDSARSRMVVPDQLLIFKKGHHHENKMPVLSHVNGEFSRDDFIKWAGAKWVDPQKFFVEATTEQISRFVEMCREQPGDGVELLAGFIRDELAIMPIDELFHDTNVWSDISETDVLGSRKLHPGTFGKEKARDKDDEKHVCPLQLEVIQRAILLGTNPGETVLDPFAGIGSVGFKAIELNRKAVLCELKPSYFRQLVNNMYFAEKKAQQKTLFNMHTMEVMDV